MSSPQKNTTDVSDLLADFAKDFSPLEDANQLIKLTDRRTGAYYCECHLKASAIVPLGTIDVPLDPEEQGEYRANRDIVVNNAAYVTMMRDAELGRSFSNIVAEYTKEFDPAHPLKIIGGQHRFDAIRRALDGGIDEYHGVKVYLGLDMARRLDVQLISNTNIAISGDLFDRLQETFQGPELRKWCQTVGFLKTNEDFADSYERGGPISVKIARTFITNYYKGTSVDARQFTTTDTTPAVCPTGGPDVDWENLKSSRPKLWTDAGLVHAGKEYAALIDAQREAFSNIKSKKPDFPEKALNIAVMSAWAYVAGMLQSNPTRLKRHFALRAGTGKDPLNAPALANGRHKTDAENYRGLGYRTSDSISRLSNASTGAGNESATASPHTTSTRTWLPVVASARSRVISRASNASARVRYAASYAVSASLICQMRASKTECGYRVSGKSLRSATA
ncbi:MAG: hypothetical protein ACRD4X_19120 [Candidatus Acidiferrales bacterium]